MRKPVGLAEYSQGQLLHECDFTDSPSILSIGTPAEKPTQSRLMPKAPPKNGDFDWSAHASQRHHQGLINQSSGGHRNEKRCNHQTGPRRHQRQDSGEGSENRFPPCGSSQPKNTDNLEQPRSKAAIRAFLQQHAIERSLHLSDGACQKGFDNVGYTADKKAQEKLALQASITEGQSIKDRLAQAGKYKDAILANHGTEMEALNKRREAENSAGQAAVDATNKAGRAVVDAANRLNAVLRSIGEYLKSLITSEQSPLSGEKLDAALEHQYTDVLGKSQHDDLTALGQLQGVTSQYLKQMMLTSSTSLDYARSFGRVQADLASVANKAAEDKTWTDKQYQENTAAYEAEALAIQNRTIAELKALDELTAAWQAELNDQLAEQALAFAKLNLTSEQILVATQGVAPAISAAISAALLTVATLNGAGGPHEGTQNFGANPDLNRYLAKKTGFKEDFGDGRFTTFLQAHPEFNLQDLLAEAPQFAAGGGHTGGWRLVGENGPELEYTGPSRIFSNGDSRKMLDNTEVVAEVRRLNDKIDRLTTVNVRNEENTRNTYETLDKVSAGGGPFEVKVIA